MKQAWVYILKCSDKSYYTGCTTNIEGRLYQHQHGILDGYTASRRPVQLVWCEQFPDIQQAMSFEHQVKGWTRKKKEALIRGDFAQLHSLAVCNNSTSSKRQKQE